MHLLRTAVLFLLLAAGLPAGPARAQMADAAAPAALASVGDTADSPVYVNTRKVVSFRVPMLGDSAAERAALARSTLEAVLAKGGPGVVTRSLAGEAVRFEVDGTTVFFLVADDLGGPRPVLLLEAASQEVQRRLETALQEAREMHDPRQLAIGAASALAATGVAALLVRLLFRLRHWCVRRLGSRLEGLQQQSGGDLVSTYAEHAHSGLRLLASGLSWAGVLLLVDLWATFVLRQFAYTRPWGERSTAWLLDLLQQFALAAAGAVPGLFTALLIFAIARLASRGITLVMARVERGDLQIGWLDPDTAGPTRRLGNVVVWLFALAMAYPYLPGANSEAFKGVSVLAGLMLSFGASGVVGQATSGLSLMYSKVLRRGEYVKIGDTEGTVTAVGLFATRIHTGMGEEVSLPSAVIVGQPVRNFSRLVADGQFVLHTAVTIGYATPWRQVHAMLLEAARRAPGVSQVPAPYVLQTALSDFYVEYRLCAQSNHDAPRRRAEAMNQLHAHIQDVFNEHGVQIMSPHYRADPAQPQIVPPGGPYAGPARADG